MSRTGLAALSVSPESLISKTLPNGCNSARTEIALLQMRAEVRRV